MEIADVSREVQTASDAALAQIAEAEGAEALERLRPSILGKKSGIRQLMSLLGRLPAEERPRVGQIINEAQEKVEAAFAERRTALEEATLQSRLATEAVDVTLPAPRGWQGALNPVTAVAREMTRIFTSMGYSVATGPEIETGFYNFDALNFPPDHPARDAHDTFFLPNGLLLRTHTSPIQIRYMQNLKPPFAVICTGRTYRFDNPDATHSPVFNQIECLVVDKGISMAHLKGTLEVFLSALFGKPIETRLRPSYFPFVEPGAEVDARCFLCEGKDAGCRVCKGAGWVELLGAGLVHPNVLRHCGVDPAVYSGFAFGAGIERIAMAKYNIRTIKSLYDNDVRFLRQFANA